MDGVTIILGLIAVSVLAVVVLWFTRNKGVVGKRVVVSDSTPKITSRAQDSAGDTDPADDWEIVPVTRTRRQFSRIPAPTALGHPAQRMRGQKPADDESVDEPLLEPFFADVSPRAAQQESVADTVAEPPTMDKPPDTPRELIVVLNIIASQEQWLDGPRVVSAVRSAGMQYGDPGIFHYVSSTNPKDEPLFSLANILNPGVFKMDEIEQLTTPGVTLFMRLPGATAAPINGLDAFTRMHDTARQLARALNADVYDERRLILTETAASQLREKIARHQRS